MDMDLAEFRDGLEAGIESLSRASADVQLLLVQLERKRAEFVVVHSLKDGREAHFARKRPMWEHEPTSEQVTDRGGDGQYLYLYWRNGHGPRPKAGGRCQRKTYVGSRPDRVKLARDMVTNLRRSRELDRAIGELHGALRSSGSHLAQAAGALVRVLDKWDGGGAR